MADHSGFRDSQLDADLASVFGRQQRVRVVRPVSRMQTAALAVTLGLSVLVSATLLLDRGEMISRAEQHQPAGRPAQPASSAAPLTARNDVAASAEISSYDDFTSAPPERAKLTSSVPETQSGRASVMRDATVASLARPKQVDNAQEKVDVIPPAAVVATATSSSDMAAIASPSVPKPLPASATDAAAVAIPQPAIARGSEQLARRDAVNAIRSLRRQW